ncbi:MAG TPA: HAD-IA family hydrolase [Candidatus Sumerlaeota bacterium]|nr:HAD-IA family hydrolase [Candidatus Sumerlaeota bacterium]
MIKWIIFDAMGVIFKVGDDTNDLLVPFILRRNPTISREQVKDSYRRASLGEISSFQFWRETGLSNQYPEIEKIYLDTRLSLNPAVVSVIDSLASRYQIGLLSNDVSEWSLYLRERYRLRSFHAVIISGDVHLRKPDPRIYMTFLQTAGATGAECIFIDDRVKNLVPAKDLGMRTILFGGTLNDAFIPDASVEDAGALISAIEQVCR